VLAEGDEKKVVEALHALDGTKAEHREAARDLIGAARPLLRRATAGLDGDARDAKVKLIAAEAARVNAPILDLERWAVTERAKDWVARMEKGVSGERIRAELYALVRANARRGPDSAPAVSDRL